MNSISMNIASYRTVSFNRVPVYALERLLFAAESYHITSIDVLLRWVDGEIPAVSLSSDILPKDMPLLGEQ